MPAATMTLLSTSAMQRSSSGVDAPLLLAHEPHPLSPDGNNDEPDDSNTSLRTSNHHQPKMSIEPPNNLTTLPNTHTITTNAPPAKSFTTAPATHPTATHAEHDDDDDDGDDKDDMNDGPGGKSNSVIVAVPSSTSGESSGGNTGKRASMLEQLSSFSYYSSAAHELVSFVYQFLTFQVILEPNSRFKNVWDYLIIGIILYNAFIIPYYIAFDITLSTTLLPLDILCTISMAIDILVTLRTAFIDFSGNTCYDSRAIARRYWNRGLILDLCGTFPMDIFSTLVIGYGQRYSNLLKVLGLLRASRLMYNDRLAAFNSPTARILKLLFGFFWMAHLFGSAFWFTACVEDHSGTWINVNNYGNASLTTQYIVSLYWALTTMVTVGYGDIVPTTVYEQAVVIPILMLSALIYATIFGNMAYAIETITSTIRRYQSRMDMVKEFISVYELPVELQKKLFDYTNAMWNQNKGFETEQMIAHLPTSVKAEVMLHINESLIQRVPLLKQCSDRFLEAIILRMSSQVCLPGDYVFKEGDKSREMYFVRTGSVEIIMEDESGVEEVIAEIHSFSDCPFFGEISLLLGETRTASAKATTKCVLSSLSQQDFFDVLSMFPDEENSLRETASQRLQNDIDREQAALKKRKGGSGGGTGNGRPGLDDDDEDEDEDSGGKSKKALVTASSHVSGGGGNEKKSKHEARLNTLEMTTLGGAANPQHRERGMSTTDLNRVGGGGGGGGSGGGGLVAPERRMSGSHNGSTATVAKGAGRMNRLNAGGALTRHGSRTDTSDSDNEQQTTTATNKLASHQSSASVVSFASDQDSEVETESEHTELEQRMSHQRELRHQLTAKETKTPRQPDKVSSSPAPSTGPSGGGAGMSAELEVMRLSRDVGQLFQKERGVEKAQLEMEEQMRGMQQHISDLNNKVDRLISLLTAQGGKATLAALDQTGFTSASDLKTARTKTLSPSHSHMRNGSNSSSANPSALTSPSVPVERRRSVVNNGGRSGPPGGAVVAKPNPIAGAVLTGSATASVPLTPSAESFSSFSSSSAD